ncbi:unnamed protein product [Moneuplotes crassus]|uniref:Uncharacterized protein n=1 Tax=Euplotes crassus TaxID=5936 RepID=A0AAD2CWW2_EUPCR|nr:unnamed protein product [Moneuplotes crassus]
MEANMRAFISVFPSVNTLEKVFSRKISSCISDCSPFQLLHSICTIFCLHKGIRLRFQQCSRTCRCALSCT